MFISFANNPEEIKLLSSPTVAPIPHDTPPIKLLVIISVFESLLDRSYGCTFAIILRKVFEDTVYSKSIAKKF